MIDVLLAQRIALALAMGILIGVERERRAKGEIVAGVRTFTLTCLFGVLSSYLSQQLGTNLPILISFAAVSVLTACSYVIRTLKTKRIGMTSEIAFILTYVIGLIVFMDSYPFLLSISMGTLVTLILVSKENLHQFARNLKLSEIRDAVIFGIISFIILPVLPNYPIDPFNVLNPHMIWESLVIILSISFAAYVAMKLFGTKIGLALTGLFGGLASSTSVAVSMAEDVKENKKLLAPASFAVIIASTTMFVRIVAVSYLFNHEVAYGLLLPFSLIGLVGYLLSYFTWKKVKKAKTSIDMKSPLALKSTIKFTLLFTAILLFSTIGRAVFGENAIYAIAIISGLVDVDAITISLSSIAYLDPATAIRGIMIACLVNTISKWALVSYGNRKMGIEVGKVFIILLIIGAVALLSIHSVIPFIF